MSYLPRGATSRPARLQRIGVRPTLPDYVREVWGRRHFIVADARARALTGQEGTVLGNAWLVLSPILNAAAYALIFGFILQTSRGVENFLHFLVVGVFLFQYSARCLTGGAQCIRGGQGLIRSFAFPRASLAISVVAREAVAMLPVIGALLALMMVLPPSGGGDRVLPGPTWLLLPLVFALHTVYNAGLALLTAPIVTRFPDLRNVVPFLSRIWFYASGVFFSIERFVSEPVLQAVMVANPLYQFLTAYRDVLVYGTVPDVGSWLVLTAWSLGFAVVGLVAFWSQEERYAADS